MLATLIIFAQAAVVAAPLWYQAWYWSQWRKWNAVAEARQDACEVIQRLSGQLNILRHQFVCYPVNFTITRARVYAPKPETPEEKDDRLRRYMQQDDIEVAR